MALSVNVVVPIYKSTLTTDDRLSLRRCFDILGEHTITAIKPETLDISAIMTEFPLLKVENFAPNYFSSKIAYNALMLSDELYARFLEWDYILIYQTDAYVFRNDLDYWCSLGYDYVGAPWVVKPIYKNPIYKLLSAVKSFYIKLCGGDSDRHVSRGKVGNGGFSLRKTSSHLIIMQRFKDVADYYISRSSYHRYYEDVFMAVEAPHLDPTFKTPSVEVALNFSFDKNPEICLKLNRGVLPFGCHGFNKRKTKRFWAPIIAANSKERD